MVAQNLKIRCYCHILHTPYYSMVFAYTQYHYDSFVIIL